MQNIKFNLFFSTNLEKEKLNYILKLQNQENRQQES